ncbi:MAG: hypothetical protein AAF997_19420 [Myxococcota bacterium]
MRGLLSLCLLCCSLVLMGQACGGSDGGGAGDGGEGGDAGAAGSAGSAGGGGTAGSAGAGGTGGASARSDCGYLTSCTPGGVDLSCEDYCVQQECGTEENVLGATCLDDGRCWCWCVGGSCSDDDCVETAECSFADPDESFCENECASVCDGAGDIREAFCDGPGDVTGRCECRCKVGGSVSCSGAF